MRKTGKIWLSVSLNTRFSLSRLRLFGAVKECKAGWRCEVPGEVRGSAASAEEDLVSEADAYSRDGGAVERGVSRKAVSRKALFVVASARGNAASSSSPSSQAQAHAQRARASEDCDAPRVFAQRGGGSAVSTAMAAADEDDAAQRRTFTPRSGGPANTERCAFYRVWGSTHTHTIYIVSLRIYIYMVDKKKERFGFQNLRVYTCTSLCMRRPCRARGAASTEARRGSGERRGRDCGLWRCAPRS